MKNYDTTFKKIKFTYDKVLPGENRTGPWSIKASVKDLILRGPIIYFRDRANLAEFY